MSNGSTRMSLRLSRTFGVNFESVCTGWAGLEGLPENFAHNQIEGAGRTADEVAYFVR